MMRAPIGAVLLTPASVAGYRAAVPGLVSSLPIGADVDDEEVVTLEDGRAWIVCSVRLRNTIVFETVYALAMG